MKFYVDIEIYRGDDNIYIACSPELNVYSNGNTQEEAAAKLKARISEYVDKDDSFFDAHKDIGCTTHYYSARSPQMH